MAYAARMIKGAFSAAGDVTSQATAVRSAPGGTPSMHSGTEMSAPPIVRVELPGGRCTRRQQARKGQSRKDRYTHLPASCDAFTVSAIDASDGGPGQSTTEHIAVKAQKSRSLRPGSGCR